MHRRDIKFAPLHHRDIVAAAALARTEQWNQTEQDWEVILQHSKAGSFGAFSGGTLIGTVTSLTYGDTLAWIGMMLVRVDHRRQGIGKALMRLVLDHCRESGIQSAKLDATPAGEPLYASLGFQTELTIQRWSTLDPASTDGASAHSTRDDTYRTIRGFDQEAFGVCRKDLLDSLIKNRCCEPVIALDPSRALAGYGLARRGANAFFLGPIAARSETIAVQILDGLVAQLPGAKLYVDYLAHAQSTPLALSERRFKLQRTLSRMSYGKTSCAGISRSIFASAGPEFG